MRVSRYNARVSRMYRRLNTRLGIRLIVATSMSMYVVTTVFRTVWSRDEILMELCACGEDF